MEKYIQLPISDQDAEGLKAGDYVYLTGTLYTARDAAHKRMQEALDRGESLPFPLAHHLLYYIHSFYANTRLPIIDDNLLL